MEGSIELLLDSRFTAQQRRARSICEWPSHHPDWWAPFEENRPRPAVVRLVDRHHDILEFAQVHPLTDITRVQLYHQPMRTTFMVAQDVPTCPGGEPETLMAFVDIRGGRWDWLQAKDTQTGELRPLRVIRSRHSAWEFAPPLPKTPPGRHRDILEVSSRGLVSGRRTAADMLVTYRRYHFDGRQWLKYESRAPGNWDSTSRFPDRAKFP